MYTLLAQVDISDPNVFAPARLLSINSLIGFIIPFISIGAALAFLGMMLLGAFQWVTAGDNAENVGKAQKTLMFAIFGLLLVFLSYAAMKIITTIFGITSLPF
jgi:hypothetical protein